MKCPYCGSEKIHIARKALSNELQATCFNCSMKFDPRFADVPLLAKFLTYMAAVVIFPGSIILNVFCELPYISSFWISMCLLGLSFLVKSKKAEKK